MEPDREEERPMEMPPEWRGIVPSQVFLDEACQIVQAGEAWGLTLRAMGGVGIRLHSPDQADLARRLGRLGQGQQEFTDLDFMAYRRQRADMKGFFESLGYRKRRDTLSTVTSEREIYFHPKGWFYVDVFYDKLLVANHPLDFRGRLNLDSPTIPLADLLLEKLQIVNISDKDVKDVLVLLGGHRVGESDEAEQINGDYIARLLADDWGFWYTVMTNLAGLLEIVAELEVLTQAEKTHVGRQIEALQRHIHAAAKSLKWKVRSLIGPRMSWYEPVETMDTVRGFGIWRLRAEQTDR